MRFELPDCKRCCLCVPLRHGILIFGYLNLFFSIFVLTLEQYWDRSHVMILFRGVGIYIPVWFSYVLYILELIFNIVLLVGAHRKNIKVIRAYYYYGIGTTLAAFLTYIVVVNYYQFPNWHYEVLQFCLAFCGLVLQCYLLLLIRTELSKLKYQRGQFQYVNHIVEALAEPLPCGEPGNYV